MIFLKTAAMVFSILCMMTVKTIIVAAVIHHLDEKKRINTHEDQSRNAP